MRQKNETNTKVIRYSEFCYSINLYLNLHWNENKYMILRYVFVIAHGTVAIDCTVM